MNLTQVKVDLNPEIVIRYAVATGVVFFALLSYYLLGLKLSPLSSSQLMLEVQAYSTAVLGIVILTSLAGFLFYQMQRQYQERNSFALVLLSGFAKLLVTVAIFWI